MNNLSRIIDLRVHGVCEPIPEGDKLNPAFAAWCRANEIIPLLEINRRGFDARRHIFIDAATHMITLDVKGCGARIFITEEDLNCCELAAASDTFNPYPGPTHEITIAETTVGKLLGVEE